MPRGGYREGKPGKTYDNRSDLQKPALGVSHSTYGDGAAQQRSQHVAPIPQTGPIRSAPQTMGAFDRPSDRPGEPVTTGLPVGPGPGPSAAMPSVDPTIELLRAALNAFPNQGTEGLLEDLRRASNPSGY